jgi:hypothetical protein
MASNDGMAKALERAELKIEWYECCLRKIREGVDPFSSEFADTALSVGEGINQGGDELIKSIVKAIGG